jgi:hypothetical protein
MGPLPRRFPAGTAAISYAEKIAFPPCSYKGRSEKNEEARILSALQQSEFVLFASLRRNAILRPVPVEMKMSGH